MILKLSHDNREISELNIWCILELILIYFNFELLLIA